MSKYVDIASTVQVLGGIYLKPELLDETGKYYFKEFDFTENFHKVLFESFNNLYELGAKQITISEVEDYLSNKDLKLAIYKSNNGRKYLERLAQTTQLSAFDYYYNKMKKMTLLRGYNEGLGMDLSWLYDVDNILDLKKKQQQEEWLDNTSRDEIEAIIDARIDKIKQDYSNKEIEQSITAGTGIFKLLDSLKESPEIGYPLYGGSYVNTVLRGARLKKLYLRSAPTGVGKSRAMIADACFIGCGEIYDLDSQKWKKTGEARPTIYISTEQEIEEIQTMMLAFLSGVNEEKILLNSYNNNELERVQYAAKILTESPLYISTLFDFSMIDIENLIKRSISGYKVEYVFFDYIHSSAGILSEISSKAKVKGLREDNILFMVSTKLKDICNKYGVFILTATQLNGDYRTAEYYDQNLLRGAKAIADKIDCGLILLEAEEKDYEALNEVIGESGYPKPDMKISVYKNRGNRYKRILIWCQSDRGTCRINPIFITDYQYKLIQINDYDIELGEESAF